MKRRFHDAPSQAIADAYWRVRVVMARAEGSLPAWEGIRIMRERPNEDASARRPSPQR